MKISTFRIIGILVLLGISRLTPAQVALPPEVIEGYVIGVTKDFEKYMGLYISPLLKGLGYGFNSGWYNTAKPHKSFGFDLTISVNAAYVPESDQNFTFIPEDYKVFDLANPSDNLLPTIMGGETTTEIRSYLDKDNPISPFVQVPVLNGIQKDIPLNSVFVPSPIIQLGVGIYKGTEIKVRWVPTFANDANIDYKYWGLGVMHDVSQWIPVMKDLKYLNISGFIGFTKISIIYNLDPGIPFDGMNQKIDFGVNTLTYEVVGSVTFSVITGFVGLGYDNFKTHLNMEGQYFVRIPGTDTGSGETIQIIEDPFIINTKDGGFRATVGARLKLAILTLHGAYTLQGYKTLNVGIGFSFR